MRGRWPGRRSRCAFGERAILKLMFGVLIRAAERWPSVKVTEFERRQMAAVRKELDHEYGAAVASMQSCQRITQQLSGLTSVRGSWHSVCCRLGQLKRWFVPIVCSRARFRLPGSCAGARAGESMSLGVNM